MNSPDMQRPEEADRRGYETRDVKLTAVLGLGLAIALFAGLSQLGLWYLFQRFQARAASQDPQLSPLTNVEQLPPPPRLQSAPSLDYAEFLDKQNQQLNSYGWVDRKQGIVRIPISRSIELAVERGLPKTKPAIPSQ